MGKLVKIVLVIALIILVIILVTIGLPAWKYHEKIKPVINVNPTHFITVSGHLDPGLYLKVGAGYTTDPNICWHYSNYLQDLIQAEFYHLVYMPDVDKNGNYTVRIPLNGLQPSHCNWQIGTLSFTLSGQSNFNKADENLWVHFYDQAKNVTDPSFLVSCSIEKTNAIDCFLKKSNFDYPNLYSKSTHINVNFIKEKSDA